MSSRSRSRSRSRSDDAEDIGEEPNALTKIAIIAHVLRFVVGAPRKASGDVVALPGDGTLCSSAVAARKAHIKPTARRAFQMPLLYASVNKAFSVTVYDYGAPLWRKLQERHADDADSFLYHVCRLGFNRTGCALIRANCYNWWARLDTVDTWAAPAALKGRSTMMLPQASKDAFATPVAACVLGGHRFLLTFLLRNTNVTAALSSELSLLLAVVAAHVPPSRFEAPDGSSTNNILECCRLLMIFGAKITLQALSAESTGSTAMHSAAAVGNVPLMKLFLDREACDVDSKDHDLPHGTTPLLVCVAGGRSTSSSDECTKCAVVDFLLDRGASVTAIDQRNGNTCLHNAVTGSQCTKCLCRLLEHANTLTNVLAKLIETRNRRGNTALHETLQPLAHLELTLILLRHGANIDAVRPGDGLSARTMLKHYWSFCPGKRSETCVQDIIAVLKLQGKWSEQDEDGDGDAV